MTHKFSQETFQYFDRAQRNRHNKEWFDKNKGLYERGVQEPFSALVDKVADAFDDELSKIRIRGKKITRPLRPSNRAVDLGFVKSHAHVSLWQKPTSRFEWNPGIHMQFGTKSDDNFYGMGLYMVSSRQLHRLRQALVDDYETIHQILSDKKLQRRWGGLLGEKYKRFPRGFDPEGEAAPYLWHRKFYLGKTPSREDVMKPRFLNTVVQDLRVAMPFFHWVRQAVGVYGRPHV